GANFRRPDRLTPRPPLPAAKGRGADWERASRNQKNSPSPEAAVASGEEVGGKAAGWRPDCPYSEMRPVGTHTANPVAGGLVPPGPPGLASGPRLPGFFGAWAVNALSGHSPHGPFGGGGRMLK